MKSNVIKVVFNLKTIEPTSYWSGEGGIELDVLSGEIVEGDSYHLVDYLLRDGQDHELAYMACVYDKENDVGFISFEGEHELEIKMGYDEKNDRINWYSDDAMEDFLEQPETKISRIVELLESIDSKLLAFSDNANQKTIDDDNAS